jgi:uncharacterized lipoprotein
MKPLRLLCIAAVAALAACGTSPTAVTRSPAGLRADEAPPPAPPPLVPTDSRGPNTFGSGN